MSPTICLNMIVKNESKIITRLFDTVFPIIDTYCICDTGSTDDTVKIIKKYFAEKHMKGKILNIPFKNFGYNRSKALEATKGMATYALLLDADMKLLIKDSFNKNELTADAYMVRQGGADFSYYNLRLVKTDINATCVCPTHEYYDLPKNATQEKLDTIFINDIGDGGCKEDKFRRDIRLLLQGIKDEPHNHRYYFYLGNSYFNIQKYENAIINYKKRIEMGGWYEEVYYSYFRLGIIYHRQKKYDLAVSTWIDGYNFYPKRTECVYQITNHYRVANKHVAAYAFYKIGKNIPFPENDMLFIHKNMYHDLFDYELVIVAFYLCKNNLFNMEDVYPVYKTLLNKTPAVFPSGYYNSIVCNYKFYSPKILDIQSHELNISTKKDEEFISSTPSIVKHGDKYVMNLRYVNYRINKKGEYVNREQITTFNECCLLGGDLSCIGRKTFEEKEVTTRYRGVEDVRLFSFDDKIYYSGVIQNTDVKNDVHITVSVCRYDPEKKHLPQTNLKSPVGSNVEKNWALFEHKGEMKVVYKWHPLTVGKIHNQEFAKEREIETPYMFHKLRGSTNGLVVEDELWFICHFVSYEDKRYYYHCLVRLNKETLELVDYSKLFTFKGSPIEYCLGMVDNNGLIVFSCSIMDNSSYLIGVPKDKLLEALF